MYNKNIKKLIENIYIIYFLLDFKAAYVLYINILQFLFFKKSIYYIHMELIILW